jgi:hypothetical protein
MTIGKHQLHIQQLLMMVQIQLFGDILFLGTKQNIKLTTQQVGKQ